MESIAQGAIAGLIAALIFGLLNDVHKRWNKHKDARYIRDLLIQGEKYVMEAEDTFHKGMGASMSSGALRAAQYNNMLRQVGVALERWTVDLSP